MWFAAGFFGYFSVLLTGIYLSNQLGWGIFETEAIVIGSAAGGWLLWLGYGAIQLVVMYRVARAKMAAAGTVDDAERARGWFS